MQPRKRLTSAEVRELFLRFFEEKGHLRVPSSSLVPQNDPTLLFTTAGMVQMKPYFLGEAAPPRVRMTSVQKSFRTTDIESVGDTSHLTFFEMLGNFSVGDYFKKEAIAWAWEFCTQRLGLDPNRLWTTVFLDDDEAEGYWLEVGVPKERIKRFGEKENFWGPAGDSGPCGPCSEVYYDLQPADPIGPTTGPNDGTTRFLEIWNLVFMQYDQAVDGSRTPLARKNIDTGSGLERVTVVLQGTDNVYDTDLFRPLVQRAAEIAGVPYGRDAETDRALRVMAEHSRSTAFLIADGVTPGNEGRGYVLRRLLRRCIRFARRLGVQGPFMGRIVEDVFQVMGRAYPGLLEAREHIVTTVLREEEQFQRTLSVGTALLEDVVSDVIAQGGATVPGDQLFRLYDTYGFPLEMAEEVAADRELTVDREGFQKAMEAQRERGRAASAFGHAREVSEAYRTLSSLATQSLAYETTEAESSVTGLIVGGGIVARASEGQQVEVVTAATPFYAEGGGQVGDVGVILGPQGSVRVTDTQRPVAQRHDFIVHVGVVESGSISVGDRVRLEVDRAYREQTTRHHTATHLLHAALRRTLGPHVRQAGSLVAPDHLRFDFSHTLSLTEEEAAAVTRAVNERVLRNIAVQTRVQPIQEALSRGALAFFGDRYGDVVRTVEIDGAGPGDDAHPFSLELCGGTHVHATGEVGFVYIVGEGSVGAGMRRIEAVAGASADALIGGRLKTLERIARQLNVPPDAVEERVAAHLEELDRARKRAETLERELALAQVQALLSKVERVGDVSLLAARVDNVASADLLREMTDGLRQAMGSGIIVLGALVNGRPSFVCAVTSDLVGKSDRYHASRLVKEVAAVAGGSGGGRAEMATAGGRDPSKLDEALAAAKGLLS
jgi:alanyl-tRNA synthetase